MTGLTLNELMKFDLDTYSRFIRHLQLHYRLGAVRDMLREDMPHVILRHDVDVSLPLALKMAKAEHDLGVKATYFILLSSRHYNSLEGNNASTIRAIAELGHEIGLHYDTSAYRLYSNDCREAIKLEVETLERLSKQKITALSCHAPKGPDSFIHIEGYYDTDDPLLRDVYVHDSQGVWSIRSLSTLLNKKPKKVLLNTHPLVWTGAPSHKSRLNILMLDSLLFLYRIRAIGMRLIHSQEACPS